MKKYIKASILILFAITMMVGMTACAGFKVINLAEYVTFEEVKGLNGYGEVEYSFDWNKLYEDVLGKIPANMDTAEAFSEYLEYEAMCMELKNCIVFTEDEKNGSLSNGDIAKLEVGFQSENSAYEFHRVFRIGIAEKKIEGLAEPKELDIFEPGYITITFEGADGFGTAECEEISGDYWQRGVQYTIDKAKNLSNGETITVTARFEEKSYRACLQSVMEYGYIVPKTATKTYTVEGLKRLASAEDITDEMIEQAKADAMTFFENHINDDGDCMNAKIVGVYFKDKKDKTEPYKEWFDGTVYYNTLNVIVAYEWDPGLRKVYDQTENVEFYDIELDENGKLKPLSSPDSEGLVQYKCTESDIMDAFFEDTDNYTVTKLK